MNRNKNKIIDNIEDDYIINNDDDIEEYENNNNQSYKYRNTNNNKNKAYTNDSVISKEQNKPKNNKSQKSSHRVPSEWIKEAKAKYQKETNNKNIINKTDSKLSNNAKKQNKNIINYDEIPVGGGMGGGANFNIEIKVPSVANPYENNKIKNNNNCEENLFQEKEIYLKKKLDDKINNTKKSNIKNIDNNKNKIYNDNNNNNHDNINELEMERKNSLVSMITQTCDHEMVGRSEFIGIPGNQNILNSNISREINLDQNMFRLTEGKQNYSLYDKNDLISKKKPNFKDNLDTSNFSSINKLTDFSTTQNLREKTENAIQLQNVQRELDNEIEMNKRLQGQIENYKSEFNNLREELVKKSDTINELQQKISKLEKELFLQGNQLIEAEAKPSQEHYEDIINNYDELKKNFDKAVERIKYLSDENAELIEKNLKLEENNKKLKKQLKLKQEKIIHMNDNKNKIKNKNRFNDNNNIENENEYDNDLENENEENEFNEDNNEEINENDNIQFIRDKNKKYNNNNNYNNYNNKKILNNKNLDNELQNNNNSNIKEKVNKEQNNNENNNNNEEKKEINEKRSIIPEDNDIFGTKNYIKSNKNVKRKIQEDGIPVIKRVEEKDNVKDIMINNYATNDDDYYNRPPVGKPKARRIKRNNNIKNNTNSENNLNNFTGSKVSKSLQVSEIEKNTYDYKENEFNDNNINEEENNAKLNKYSSNKTNNRIFPNNNKENKINRNPTGSSITTSVGVFPSQLKVIANEREILNLESKLFNLQKERDFINDEYLKYPEYPKKREEINAKRKIEIKLEEMNKEISLQKLKIRELKEQK